MTNGNIYNDIAKRTDGEIYAGVVGPVRSGKSTFIKRFMELLVLPAIDNTYVQTRVRDQLPQSGDGKTITTTEPKFVPEEAITVKIGTTSASVRLVDCVGYLIPGVLGHVEDGKSRMVKTPWDDEEMPFEEAAEKGTTKVIKDHSTIGIIITCDGSFGDIPRSSYAKGEDKTIELMKTMGKPYIVLLNSANPTGKGAKSIADEIGDRNGVPVLPINCMQMTLEDIEKMFSLLINQFPAREILLDLPQYMDALPPEHWIKSGLVDTVTHWMEQIDTMGSAKDTLNTLLTNETIGSAEIEECQMASGRIIVNIKLKEGLYYEIIEELLNHKVENDYELFKLLKDYALAKSAYDELKGALESVSQTGYGIVHPKIQQMELGKPEVFKQGNKYGVRLTAKAPCLHIIKTDLSTEVAPIVGSERQSQDLANYLSQRGEKGDGEIWETNLFGKTLQQLVAEQMEGKVTSMPDSLQGKVQKSLQKISNEGKDYFICIII